MPIYIDIGPPRPEVLSRVHAVVGKAYFIVAMEVGRKVYTAIKRPKILPTSTHRINAVNEVSRRRIVGSVSIDLQDV